MMKKTLAISLLSLCSYSAQAQTVNDVPLKDIDVEYVQIVGTSKLFSSKLTIEIDFGQRNKVFSDKDTRLKDADGKNLDFNSMIDALNFMVKNGYEFMQAYAILVQNQNVNQYILRKKK